jgi:hypothetical protein
MYWAEWRGTSFCVASFYFYFAVCCPLSAASVDSPDFIASRAPFAQIFLLDLPGLPAIMTQINTSFCTETVRK